MIFQCKECLHCLLFAVNFGWGVLFCCFFSLSFGYYAGVLVLFNIILSC